MSCWNRSPCTNVTLSATPAAWELNESGGVFVEQVIRPTGLIDPVCIVRPAEKQVDDLGSVQTSAEGKAEPSKRRPRVREALSPQRGYGQQAPKPPEKEIEFDAAMTASQMFGVPVEGIAG